MSSPPPPHESPPSDVERHGPPETDSPPGLMSVSVEPAAVTPSLTAAGSRCAWPSSPRCSPVSRLAVAALPGLGEVRAQLSDASPGWLVLAALLQVGSCLACVVAFRSVFCRRMPWRLSYEIAIAAQGTNVLLPSGGAGGLAVAAWALRKTG